MRCTVLYIHAGGGGGPGGSGLNPARPAARNHRGKLTTQLVK